jgi:RNA polymerase sigma factor (sigma-70 family)
MLSRYTRGGAQMESGGEYNPDRVSRCATNLSILPMPLTSTSSRRHLQPLQRWATGRLPKWARDLADTDDLVQETLAQTFKRIERFEPRRVGALQAYLRQAVLNRIRDELRRKRRRPDLTELDGLELDRAISPLEQAIGQEAVDRYERALERLQPEEREAIIARVEMGYTYEELAEALDKPTADAARKAAQRALVRLAEEMKRGRERRSS